MPIELRVAAEDRQDMDRRSIVRVAAVAALLASHDFGSAICAYANPLESLVMPGPVIAGHADLESDCGECHQPFQRRTEHRLCVDCHDDVRGDLEHAEGFHGLRARELAPIVGQPRPYDVDCRQCHSEHRGRKADIVGLDEDLFDHAWTNYPLGTAHARVACAGCHKPTVKHRDAPGSCVACHQRDDVHSGGLGEDCASCHEDASWSNTRFDHGQTDFRLSGSHSTVDCATCHPGQRYSQTPTECVDCHRIDDAHDGRRGEQCRDCHGDLTWRESSFDHETTDFLLRGEHQSVACEGCHLTSRFGDASTRCADCHRADDVHKGALGVACESCHADAGWLRTLRFDHDLTEFPLIGLHTLAACEACHPSQEYSGVATACRNCHENDDAHAGTLGERCQTCHTPNGWERWSFDHDSQTRYPLGGAHQGVDCRSCHIDIMTDEILPPMQCVGCHRGDDAHDGGFGRRCGDCHTVTKFSDARVDR